MKNNIILNIQNEIEGIKSTIEELKTEIKKAEENKENGYEEKIANGKKQIENCEKKIKALKTIIRTIKSSNTKIQKRIKELPELETQKEELSEDIKIIEQDELSKKNEIKNNKEEIRKLSKEIIRLTKSGKTDEMQIKLKELEKYNKENDILSVELEKIKLEKKKPIEKKLKEISKKINIAKGAKKSRRNAVDKFIKNKPTTMKIVKLVSDSEKRKIYQDAKKAYEKALFENWTTFDAEKEAKKVAEEYGFSYEELIEEFEEKSDYQWNFEYVEKKKENQENQEKPAILDKKQEATNNKEDKVDFDEVVFPVDPNAKKEDKSMENSDVLSEYDNTKTDIKEITIQDCTYYNEECLMIDCYDKHLSCNGKNYGINRLLDDNTQEEVNAICKKILNIEGKENFIARSKIKSLESKIDPAVVNTIKDIKLMNIDKLYKKMWDLEGKYKPTGISNVIIGRNVESEEKIKSEINAINNRITKAQNEYKSILKQYIEAIKEEDPEKLPFELKYDCDGEIDRKEYKSISKYLNAAKKAGVAIYGERIFGIFKKKQPTNALEASNYEDNKDEEKPPFVLTKGYMGGKKELMKEYVERVNVDTEKAIKAAEEKAKKKREEISYKYYVKF